MWPKFLLCFFLFCFLIQEIECKSTSRRKPARTGAHKRPNGRKWRPGAGKRRKRPGKGGKRRRKRPKPEQFAALAGAVAGGAAVGAAVNANKPIPTASPSARPSTKADEPEQPLNTRAYWKGPTADPQAKYPRSCQDILVDAAKAPGCKLPEAGKYIIQPRAGLMPKWVDCMFDAERAYTVIQSRYVGEVCFNRNWDDYVMGFGCPVGVGESPDWYDDYKRGNDGLDPNRKVEVPDSNTSMCPKSYYSPYHSDNGAYTPDDYPNTYRGPNPQRTYMLPECNGEQWLGLEYQYFVQKSHSPSPSKLVAYIASDRKTYQYVTYEKFAIGNWQKDYAITEIDGFDEDLDDISNMFQFPGNSLLGAKFSTSDRDNDGTQQRNCASESESGWWFNDCASTKVNLNGMYHASSSMPVEHDVKTGKPIHPTPNDGIFWRNSNRKWESLRMTKILIGPTETLSLIHI